LEIFAIVIAQVIIADAARETKAATNQEVAHNGLKAGLTAFKVGTSEQ